MRSAACLFVIRFRQSGQYLTLFDFEAKDAPHTVQRFLSSVLKSSAYSSLSRGSSVIAPLLWICYAIETRFRGKRYKSLIRLKTRPQRLINQGLFHVYCVTKDMKKAAFLFFLCREWETPLVRVVILFRLRLCPVSLPQSLP